MFRKKDNLVLNHKKKDRWKIGKVCIQFSIILIVGVLVMGNFVDIKKYDEPDRAHWNNTNGFIALSYFGVDRQGTSKLIAKKELDKQLKALVDQGYETISQQDILNFYERGKPLPKKALFLSFEDGRNDSSIFTHPLLKKYNYKATFLSYANKMGISDHKFLQPKDLLQMKKGGYWEMGSNGNRLTYINIFDRDGNYIGVRDENELSSKEEIEFYNHYSMDFIRDHNMIPLENKEEMETRIKEDYQLMKDIYEEQLGFVPDVYMIMHANALYGAANELVSDVNDQEIQQTFAMHFNLEGNAYNEQGAGLYNLTRIQPATYWSTNHLLMKIQKDTKEKMEFIIGDENRASHWQQLSGASEFNDNRIVLTSEPAKEGKLYLSNSEHYQDVKIVSSLSGNVVGKQAIYLRYDQVRNSYLRIALENNKILVEEKRPGQANHLLGTYKLDAIVRRTEDLAFDQATVYTKAQITAVDRPSKDNYPIASKATRQVEISVQDDKLNVWLDNELLVADQNVSDEIAMGGIALESAYHQQNMKDDIYDGVFDNVIVTSVENQRNEEVVLFSNSADGFQKVFGMIKASINLTGNWVIDKF
ncbi:polysaccharide deacetylase family protein [Sporosarcina sp. FSL K6-1508]|uniref:polysaccharide deacetylase family protein n=1 Tax=Sporosarcina sp. FSL K6-1508 TaxID=2921553 RepID=UPI0030FC3654